MPHQPRIALFDIETAPNTGYTWGKWEQDVIEFIKPWYMLSFAYKWLGEKHVYTHALPDYSSYRRSKDDDRQLLKELWRVLDEADVAIAHNGDRFDVRKTNARFIAHGMRPPTPYKTVDTLKLARKHFAFDSNKLDDLGQYLDVGHKLPHTGKHLWLGCMAGDLRSWALMVRYNKHDVELLERVYLKLRPWANSPAQHPQLNWFTKAHACPTCQSENIKKEGFLFTKTGRRQRFSCLDCGAWSTMGPLIREAA